MGVGVAVGSLVGLDVVGSLVGLDVGGNVRSLVGVGSLVVGDVGERVGDSVQG